MLNLLICCRRLPLLRTRATCPTGIVAVESFTLGECQTRRRRYREGWRSRVGSHLEWARRSADVGGPHLLGPVTPLWRMFVRVGKEILKVLPQAMKTLSGTFPGEAVPSVAAWFKARSWDRRGPRCLSMPLVIQRQLHRKFIGDIYPLADQYLRPSFPPE